MFIPFHSLPSHSRVWIYQSDKKFTPEQKDIISQQLSTFTQQWQVHGAPMEASFDIRYNQFIVLAANHMASGCSIDNSVRTIKELGTRFNIDFFNRSIVAFLKGDEIILLRLQELKKKFEEGTWNAETITFNNLVDTKESLEFKWQVPAALSWLKRYLPANALT